jgi:hypothetical protein
VVCYAAFDGAAERPFVRVCLAFVSPLSPLSPQSFYLRRLATGGDTGSNMSPYRLPRAPGQSRAETPGVSASSPSAPVPAGVPWAHQPRPPSERPGGPALRTGPRSQREGPPVGPPQEQDRSSIRSLFLVKALGQDVVGATVVESARAGAARHVRHDYR